MPLSWDETLYGELYGPIGYNRSWALAGEFREWVDQTDVLSQRMGINNAATALFVGCGYGFLIEVAIDAAPGGWDKAWGTDISPFIQSTKTTHARSDVVNKILDIDITQANAVTLLKNAGVSTNGRVQWVITDLISGFSDAEIPGLLSACDSLRQGNGGVAHIIYPTIPDVIIDLGGGNTVVESTDQSVANLYLNMKTADEWVALNPSHWWIDVCGWSRNTEGKRILVWNPTQGAWI